MSRSERASTSGPHHQWAIAALPLILVLAVVAACTGVTQEAPPVNAPSDASTPPPSTADSAVQTPSTLTLPAPSKPPSPPPTSDPNQPTECPDPDPLDFSGPSAQAVPLASRADGSPSVEVVPYPHPSYAGNPWSQWGQGLVLDDGRFVSAIGDHQGVGGNAFLYEYEPATKTLTQVTDVLSLVDYSPGDFGYGKIHAQMVPGPCGDVFLTTYWGSRVGLTYDGTYWGDWILRWDPSMNSISSLGIPVSQHGIPSMAGWSAGGLLYGEAVDPREEGTQGLFFVYSIEEGEVVFIDEEAPHVGFRSILVDSAGRAYYSAGQSRLNQYDPATGEIRTFPASLPGEWLRAATRPAADGTVYGVTTNPDVLFALEPDGTIRDLGSTGGYTTSLALSPDDRTLYYVPGAHGDSWQQGTPVIAVDVETGETTTIVELNELAERRLGLRLGGTYNLVADPTGQYLFIGFNAGSAGENSFGEVVLVIVHLP